MSLIRLALCITDLNVGGAERCLQQLATGLDRSRFEPAVYSLAAKPEEPEHSCVGPIEAAGIPVHCLGARFAWELPMLVSRLKHLLAAQSPQIAQTFLFHANFIGRIAARRAQVPHVLSGIRVAERHSRWHLWLDRATRRLVDRYVCVSRSVAEFTIRHVGVPEHQITVIPNGIDPVGASNVAPADLSAFGLESGRPVVTFVGRLEPQKGLFWLLEAAAKWLPIAKCELLIVGQGSQRRPLQARAAQLKIGDRVHFAGWQENVLEILAASDLLVLPSRWEGMANVILQAMALGLPVIATDVEGTRELLGPIADEQTVAYGDTEDLLSKVFTMIEDRQKATDLGLRNRHRAESEFSLARMVETYQDLWEALAQS